MNKNYILVYDFETVGIGVDPHTCEPFQVAAMVIHPRKLELIEGATFSSFMCPPDFDKLPDEALEYHAKVRHCSVPDIRKLISEAPSQANVWQSFVKFIEMYHADGSKKKSMFSAPIRAGTNIKSYDNIIWDRMCLRYGNVTLKNSEQNLAHPRDCIDLLELCFYWFENMEEPKKYNMDYLRPYFGLSTSEAHDAIFDTKQCAELIMRFLRLHRATSAKVNFANACVGV